MDENTVSVGCCVHRLNGTYKINSRFLRFTRQTDASSQHQKEPKGVRMNVLVELQIKSMLLTKF